MKLTLKITSYQSQTLGSESSKTFGEFGGSIGRSQSSDLMLPDPERYISGQHASIDFRDGLYYLTDTSTNGIFVNGSPSPLGNGNTVPLSDGDCLVCGDYEIAVDVDSSTFDANPPDIFTAPTNSGGGSDAAQTSPTGQVDLLESLDPLDFTTPPSVASPSTSPSNPFDTPNDQPGALADHTPPLMESFQVPGANPEQIPDDWDMTGIGAGNHSISPSPLPEEAKAPAAAPVPDSSDAISPSEPSPVPEPVSTGDYNLFAAFFRGAGLDPTEIQHDDRVKKMEGYGQLFKVVVEGMMEVLMARASLKSEFRMQLTTIRPVENNPLKFSPNADEALRTLFVDHGGSYLSPTQAVGEGFEDIKNHQMAMVAGMQAAFQKMIEHFDPTEFDKIEEGRGVRAVLKSVNRKSNSWDAYCDFYRQATQDADSSFQHLFGDDFTAAYEEQISRLVKLRQKKS